MRISTRAAVAATMILAACTSGGTNPASEPPATTTAATPTQEPSMSAVPDLDVDASVRAELDRATLYDVSYASPGGGRVSGWLVVPEGSGPFAGIVYLHGSETDRDDLLDEAMAMAGGGAVTLTIDAPFARRGEDRTGTLGNYFTPGAEAALTQQTLDDLARAIDLLVERPDVDPARIGFVGHSWGASLGAVLAATDGRAAASVLITGRPSWTGFLRGRYAEAMAGVVSTIGEEEWEAYLASMEPFDAVPAVADADGERLYLQFGTLDDVVIAEDVAEWEAAAPDGTRIDRYAAGHTLDADAVADRAAWLVERLGLEPISADALAAVGLPDEATIVP